jgi:hypothetical protein
MRRRALDAASNPARGFASGADYRHGPSLRVNLRWAASAGIWARCPAGGIGGDRLSRRVGRVAARRAGALLSAGGRRERRRVPGARWGCGGARGRGCLRLRGAAVGRRRSSGAASPSGLARSASGPAARGVRRAAPRCGRSDRRCVSACVTLPRRLGPLVIRRRGILGAARAGQRQLGERGEPDQARRERGQPAREQEAESRRGQPHGVVAVAPAGHEPRHGVFGGLFDGPCWHRGALVPER